MPLNYLLESRISLNSAPYHISDDTIDGWPFWKFQDKINRINQRNKKAAQGSADTIDPRITELLNRNHV